MIKLAPAVVGLVVGIGAVATLSAVAQTDPAPEEKPVRKCINGPNIDTTVIDQNTLLAEDRGRGALVLKVAGCRLNGFDPLLFEYRGTTQICNPIDVQMSVIYAPGFKSACFVESVTPISLEEAKAMRDSLNKSKKK